MSNIIVLIGPPGAGKSTIGKKLARLLDFKRVDSDTEIESFTSKKITELFAEQGEEGFRKLETEVIRKIIEENDQNSIIVSLGAGAVTSATTRELLRSKEYDIKIVYLNIPLKEGVKRVKKRHNRPLFSHGDVTETYKNILKTRKPYYQDLSHVEILVKNIPAQLIAEQIANSLGYKAIDKKD